MEQVSRMAAEVNKLIGLNLLDSKAVNIPELGSLFITVNPQGIKSVAFDTKEPGLSIVEIIKDRAACTPEQATEIVSRWVAEVRTAEALVIEGVGSLNNDGTFTTKESFATQLNPNPPAEAVAEPAPAPKVAKRVTPKVAPKSDKKKPCPKAIVAIIVLFIVAAGGYFAYTSIQKANAEKAEIERIAQERAVEQQRIADSIALAQIEAQRAAQEVVVVEEPPRYRVVYGIYELRSNVDVAIKRINKEYGADQAHEYPFGTFTMVSMFESDSRQEAQNFLMENYDLYPDSWVYDSKQ